MMEEGGAENQISMDTKKLQKQHNKRFGFSLINQFQEVKKGEFFLRKANELSISLTHLQFVTF